jgi:hypothetical protein
VRWLERRWKLSGLAIDKEILLQALADLRSLISTAKVNFLNSKIVEQTGKKSLFKIVDSFLLKKPSFRLPSHMMTCFPLLKFVISGLVSCYLAQTWNLSIL